MWSPLISGACRILGSMRQVFRLGLIMQPQPKYYSLLIKKYRTPQKSQIMWVTAMGKAGSSFHQYGKFSNDVCCQIEHDDGQSQGIIMFLFFDIRNLWRGKAHLQNKENIFFVPYEANIFNCITKLKLNFFFKLHSKFELTFYSYQIKIKWIWFFKNTWNHKLRF